LKYGKMEKNTNKLRTLREIKNIFKKKIKPDVIKWINGSAEYVFTTIKNRSIFRCVSIIPEGIDELFKKYPLFRIL